MKTKLSLVMLILFALFSTSAYSEEGNVSKFDFKQFVWGSTLEEVIDVEGTYLASDKVDGKNDTVIIYRTKAVGMDVILGYYFCDNGLYQVVYSLDEEHTSGESYINDYEKFRDALTKKYGKPLFDRIKWNDSSMKEYYLENGKSKGDALTYGYCSYSTGYQTDRSLIAMSMSSDNYEISTTIVYQSTVIDFGEADYSDEI